MQAFLGISLFGAEMRTPMLVIYGSIYIRIDWAVLVNQNSPIKVD